MESFSGFIDGKPIVAQGRRWSIINPATEQVCRTMTFCEAADVDLAVAAARRAFPAYAEWSVGQRIEILGQIFKRCTERAEEFVDLIVSEIGAPIGYARSTHLPYSLEHFEEMVEVLAEYPFVSKLKHAQIIREPIGVCGLIIPWNWPLGQIVAKAALALAAGCTIVLKPSEWSPTCATLFAEICAECGLPPGVFNVVTGDGLGVGATLASHPGVDMISFTGSTRAGIEVAKLAATTVKRVAQELGGKSPSIMLSDADLDKFVPVTVLKCFENAGQTCQAPTLLYVSREQRDRAVRLACETAERIVIGDPRSPTTQMGPVVNVRQFNNIQRMIQDAISEGATMVCGGAGRPSGQQRGYFVRPTIFADVSPTMRIAKEEIFGPVLSILTYETEEEAIRMATATDYGLAAYVQTASPKSAAHLARTLPAGRVYFNFAPGGRSIPFGGYKQSGNGREHGIFGLEQYLETKAVCGLSD